MFRRINFRATAFASSCVAALVAGLLVSSAEAKPPAVPGNAPAEPPVDVPIAMPGPDKTAQSTKKPAPTDIGEPAEDAKDEAGAPDQDVAASDQSSVSVSLQEGTGAEAGQDEAGFLSFLFPPSAAQAEPEPDPFAHINPYEWPLIDAPISPKPLEWTDDETAAIAFTEAMTAKALEIVLHHGDDRLQCRQDLAGLLDESFDIDRLSRILLGEHIVDATPQQLESYQAIVVDYLVNLYAAQVQSVIRAEQITVDAHHKNRTFIVRTALPNAMGEKPTFVDWRVNQQTDGGFKFIDVSVNGISLAIAKRNEFDAAIENNGFDGFLEMLYEQAGLELPEPVATPTPPKSPQDP